MIENVNLLLGKTIKFDTYEIEDMEINEYLSILCIKLGQDQFVVFDTRDELKIDFRVSFKIDLSYKEKIIKL